MPRAAKAALVLPARPERAREEELRREGYALIIGVDEAGRGPLAGPVVAGAVALPPDFDLARFPTLHDSKQIAEAEREELFDRLTREVAHGAGESDASEIDRVNIRQATWLAMQRAVADLLQVLEARGEDASACFVLLDGLGYGDGPWPYEALVKGDAREACIAAASIVAKVHRDRLMRTFDAEFCGYGFASHKGYPSPAHLAALAELGPCEIHRRTFGPVRRVIEASAAST